MHPRSALAESIRPLTRRLNHLTLQDLLRWHVLAPDPPPRLTLALSGFHMQGGQVDDARQRKLDHILVEHLCL
jgi:hypothetical protein